jgi:hypothetical protein
VGDGFIKKRKEKKRTRTRSTPAILEMDALELESSKQNPALQTAKDLFSGAVGGIAQVLIGMF